MEKTADENENFIEKPKNEKSSQSGLSGMVGIKTLALVLLVVQNASLVLTMRSARTQEGEKFSNTAAVFICECLKVFASSILLLILEFGFRPVNCLTHMHDEIIKKPVETLKVAVPAFIYTLQNNLLYIAVSNLPAATFQVSYQMKILTTALFSVFMLKKSLIKTQWLAMLLLFAGVAIVQSDDVKESAVSSEGQSQFIGFIAVLISCISSGFAGVYFEKILKGSSASIWLRNIQLGLFGALLAFAGMHLNDGEIIREKGILHGFNSITWIVVMNQAFGGLLVAIVIKYADNIIKGFATSIAIVVSTILSIFLFGFTISFQFVFGAILVISAVYIYSLPPPSGNSSVSKV